MADGHHGIALKHTAGEAGNVGDGLGDDKVHGVFHSPLGHHGGITCADADPRVCIFF